MKLFVFEFLRELDLFFVDFGNEFLETGGFVGSFSIKHLIEDDTHGPDVTFGGVSVSIEDFGTHVHGATDKRLVDLLQFRAFLIVLGESEVGNLVDFILNQNISRFKVSVDDGMFVKVFVAINKLFHDDKGLVFGQFFTLLEYFFKGASVAQLLKEINVVGGFFYVVKLYDVIVLD